MAMGEIGVRRVSFWLTGVQFVGRMKACWKPDSQCVTILFFAVPLRRDELDELTPVTPSSPNPDKVRCRLRFCNIPLKSLDESLPPQTTHVPNLRTHRYSWREPYGGAPELDTG
jgi:hypothetical protein